MTFKSRREGNKTFSDCPGGTYCSSLRLLFQTGSFLHISNPRLFRLKKGLPSLAFIPGKEAFASRKRSAISRQAVPNGLENLFRTERQENCSGKIV
ncbi:hypothetical protein HMPREF3038_00282 [Akkermansia sp. KLE1797]|nr:hypothetical protein HMPREF3038_00282 [Akkermansia sp. KLE1797]